MVGRQIMISSFISIDYFLYQIFLFINNISIPFGSVNINFGSILIFLFVTGTIVGLISKIVYGSFISTAIGFTNYHTRLNHRTFRANQWRKNK